MTNGAAIGYAILAAKSIGLGKEIIKLLESAMYSEMDFTGEDAAEKAYQNF